MTLFFLVQPKVSSNSVLELKIGDIAVRTIQWLSRFKARNFDSSHRSCISEGQACLHPSWETEEEGLLVSRYLRDGRVLGSHWLSGTSVWFGYFNNEITCLINGTFKGTVEADSCSNMCHYPIS